MAHCSNSRYDKDWPVVVYVILAPDLKRGFTFASFHNHGNSPVVMFLFTLNIRLESKIFADNLRILGTILSRPVYLLTFKFDTNCLTKVIFVNRLLNSVFKGTFD